MKGLSSTDYNCNYNTKTKKWTCVEARTISGTPNQTPGSETLSKMTGSQIPLELKSALDAAIKTENNGLETGHSDSSGVNSSASTIINSPQVTQSQPRRTPDNSFDSKKTVVGLDNKRSKSSYQ